MKQNPEKSARIEGYFLSFTEEEFAKVNKMLSEEGLTEDLDGLKKFILECCEEEHEEKPRDRAHKLLDNVEDFIIQNPQTVNALLNAGKKLFSRK